MEMYGIRWEQRFSNFKIRGSRDATREGFFYGFNQ